MDDSLQFIIESPQHTPSIKKRPRLVTSCDNCRLKKIKCLQSTPEAKCEACKLAKLSCRFRDRERYFAERSRVMSGPGASSPSSPSSNYSNGHKSEDSGDGFMPSGIVSPEDHGRYQPYSTDKRRSTDNTRATSPQGYHSSRSTNMSYSSVSPSPSPMIQHARSQSSSQARQIQLFNPDFAQYPNHTYMEAFMPVFFQHYQQEYPFIIYADVIADYVERRSAPIINTIAAFAVPYCNIPDLTGRNLSNVIQAYADNARAQLNSSSHVTSEEQLRGLILFAGFEYKQTRMDGFRSYAQLALRMCSYLGYTSANGQLVNVNDSDRRRYTSKALLQLNYTLSNLR